MINSDIELHFPKLRVLTSQITNVKVRKQNAELEEFKNELTNKVKKQYNLDSLKDEASFRAYRDFFWKVGVDPTKNRPAVEALVRRILRGENLPCINTLVDAYNLASIKTEIALASFDADKLIGTLLMRVAKIGEEFMGIGMSKSMILQGYEVVISDEEKLVAIYPYRDADDTKVTEKTRSVLLLICGVPRISEESLRNARHVAIEFITRFCGGEGRVIE
jgi:DNA/RNA-binding domain of Phe-tRNA-synthetase-like protein